MGTSIALQEIVTFTLSTHMITGLYHHKVELYNTSAHICTCWRVSHLCTHMPEDNTSAPHNHVPDNNTSTPHAILYTAILCTTLAFYVHSY